MRGLLTMAALQRAEPLANPARGWRGVMRTLQLSLASAVGLLLLGGSVLAQEDAQSLEPPVEFSGSLGCPDAIVEGNGENVVLGPVDDGNLVRREWRGTRFTWVLTDMSDPRLDGTLTVHMDRDEYVYPGVDLNDPPALMSATMRIENEAGAWHGSAPDAYIPGGPPSTWGVVPLAGEDAYEGLTAAWSTNLQDPDCACWDTENLCVHDVRGAVFAGDMPATPTD